METITIHLELTDDEAAALAQFLKRAGHGLYRQCAAIGKPWGGAAAPSSLGCHALQGMEPPCSACLSVENPAPSRPSPAGAARP